ncbi:MAG: TonB family protein [Fluviicola sp.]
MKAIFLFLFLLPNAVFAGKSYNIYFTVIDRGTSAPIPGAQLLLNNETLDTVVANGKGEYIFEAYTERSFEITVIAEGYYKRSYFGFNKKRKDDVDIVIELSEPHKLYLSKDEQQRREERLTYWKELREVEMKKLLEEVAKVDTATVPSCFQLEDDEEPVMVTEDQFPGGPQNFHRYIVDMIVYPEAAIDRGEQGKVYVAFEIETDGSLTNIRIERGVSDALDAEVLRLFNEMPKWLPHYCNGRALKVRARYPIIFTLN